MNRPLMRCGATASNGFDGDRDRIHVSRIRFGLGLAAKGVIERGDGDPGAGTVLFHQRGDAHGQAHWWDPLEEIVGEHCIEFRG